MKFKPILILFFFFCISIQIVAQENVAAATIEQLEKENKELKENIAILEKELISSKGKLGEVLNELADLEGQKFVRAKDKLFLLIYLIYFILFIILL